MNPFDITYLYILLVIFNLIFLYFFSKIKKIVVIYDVPDQKRKLHLVPIPLLGGILIILNLIISIIYLLYFDINQLLYLTYYSYSIKSFLIFIFVFISLFILGLFDDKFSLSPIKRLIVISFLVYILCTTDYSLNIDNLNFSFLNFEINFKQLSKPFTLVCFIFLIISLNMFDGINLQSAIFYLTNFITILILTNSYNPILLSIIIGLIFFSYLNYKNKCFLGDSGTYLLSFLLGYYLIRLHNNYDVVFTDDIVNILFLPIIDSIRVIIKRMSINKEIFLPDNSHLHHRLLKKFGYEKTISLITFMIIIPQIALFLGLSSLFIFLFQVIIYFFSIIISKNASY